MSTNQTKTTAKDKKARIAVLIVTLIVAAGFIAWGAVMLDSYYLYPPYDDPYDWEDSYTVSGNMSTGVNYLDVKSSGYTYYKLTVYQSGYYNIYSTNGSSSFDPEVKLYSSSWSLTESNDDGGEGMNFQLNTYLYSGTTYYIGVRIRSGSSSKSLTVYVERN